MFAPPGGNLFAFAILLLGLNLRPTIAAIGPLLDAIQRDTGLSDTDASLLTALPVALMGVCLLGTAALRRVLGERRGVAIGGALIILSGLMRCRQPTANLLLVTAALGGIGIAFVQALLPVVIRHRAGPRAADLMGLYSTAIMAGALLSGAASPWMAQACGWPLALGAWALPTLAGSMVWWRATTARGDAPDNARRGSVLRAPRAWLLMAFFGLGTGAYTLILAWLPPFYTRLGWTAEAAGLMLGVVTMAEVIAGFAVSLWGVRSPDRRPALFGAIAALFAGMLGLSLAPLVHPWPSAILAGLGVGALFPLSLIVAMDHGEDAVDAGAIAGFVQGGGYVLAAGLPLVAGFMRQNLADLSPAWSLMAALCSVLGLIAIRLRPSERIAFPC